MTSGPRSSTCWPRGSPWNGYQLIQEIGERTQGVWRPSAGSVYPALQQLEDEGLITAAAAGEDRRRNYTLTDEGRAYVEAHADELRASWDAVTGSVDDAAVQMHDLARQVMVAVSGRPGGLARSDPAGQQGPGRHPQGPVPYPRGRRRGSGTGRIRVTPAISVSELTKNYGEIEAVRGIDFEVAAGETFGFLGPNGAGKSTTIKILCTLADPTSGSARVAGTTWSPSGTPCAATSAWCSRRPPWTTT